MQVLKLKIMKKITLIFLFFVLFHNVLQSQNFAPIGTKWRYDFSAFGQGAGIIEYEAQKDTILFGLSCRQISNKTHWQPCIPPYPLLCQNNSNSAYNLYFHQRNDSLFEVRLDGKIIFVFNFKANIGDTLKVVSVINSSSLRENALVTRKSDTIIGGQTLKFWELTQYCLVGTQQRTFSTKVFEKFYRILDGLFIYGRCTAVIEYNANLCLFESGNWRYEPFACRATSVNNLEESASINISPNPSFDKININSSVNFKRFSIYNTSGQLIKNDLFFNPNEINISDLCKGFYLIQLIDNKELSVYRKFIKQ